MTSCPLCRLPLRQVGRLVEARDDVGLYFVFEICQPCRSRLDRLPHRLQEKQHRIAVSNLARHPDRFDCKSFDMLAEARLYRVLLAEQMNSMAK